MFALFYVTKLQC